MLRGVLTRNPMVFTGRGETRFFQNLPLLCQEFPNLGDDRVLDDYVVYLIKLVVTKHEQAAVHAAAGYAPDASQWDDGGLLEITPRTVLSWTKFNEDPTKFVFEEV